MYLLYHKQLVGLMDFKSHNFDAFFNYLTCYKAVLSSHPLTEVLYVEDFNIHHIVAEVIPN